MKPKCFITRKIPDVGLNKIGQHFEIEVWEKDTPPPKEILREKVRYVNALVTLLTDPIDKEVLANAPKLRIISQYAVGYDNIDIEECTRRGIYVTNTPGVLTNAVADLTWALILSITRRIVEAHDYVISGKWEESKVGWHPTLMLGTELKGKILGIIGMGRIGQAVAKRAIGFGMKVIYFSRKRKEEIEKELNAEFVDLNTLLRKSDIISIHVSLNKDTYHMINSENLRLVKPTAYLINTSRGAVIDEKALYIALTSGKIAGAALDVFEREPTLSDNPLLKLRNVIATPHIGSATNETRNKMAEIVADNLIAFLNNTIPPNLVNTDVRRIRKPGFD